jgi:CBS domain-containing protein
MRHDRYEPTDSSTVEPPVDTPSGPRVSDRMTCPAVTIRWAAPIAQAVRLMQMGHVHHLPVVDADQRLLGVVTAAGACLALLAAGVEDVSTAPPSMVVGNVMGGDTTSVSPHVSLADAARLMHDRNLSALPVVQGGQVVGIMTVHDLDLQVAT